MFSVSVHIFFPFIWELASADDDIGENSLDPGLPER